jgi:tetratricopeptide (TPR) repeat protein
MKIFVALFLAVLCTLQSGAVQAKPALQTRDNWRSVRTNNLFVIGNADAEKLRQVAAWLEFFHSSFARLVSRNVLNSSVPTTVIIFRDDASFTPFKPLYQGRPANIAGFFQPGDDVNYIAISLDTGERDPFSTAFHEYVHLHLRDNVPGAPVWLNEGLAELYGSLQFSGNDALLGAPIVPYIRILRDHELLPLETLFSIGTNSPHYNEQDKSGIFYGQSWALVHYLMLGDRGRQEQFKRFLQQVSRGEEAAKAIEGSFGITLAKLEEDFQSYVRRGDFTAQRIAGVNDPQAYTSYTAMQRTSLTEGEANYYLGDLLLHIGRDNDAERYFKQAVALDPSFLPANAALGLLYAYRHRYDDAKRYLQKATTSPQTYMVHYLYAYVLSREGMSADGTVSDYSAENAAVIREQLQLAIKLAPNHAPSHHLLAVVDYIRNERLDEALNAAQKAHQLTPGNKDYSDLIDRIQLARADTAGSRRSREPIKATAIAEPAKTGTSRLLGGDSSGVAINDGQTVASSGSLPSVDEVLRRFIEAIGGETAINATNSRMTKGTLDVAGVSRGGSFELYAVAPNKALMVMQAHPLGTVKLGFDGHTGWTINATGKRLLKGAELAKLQRDSEFYEWLRMKTVFAKVTLPGMSKIGFRDVYVLDMQPATGAVERMYLDAQTYLPVRINSVRVNGTVPEPVETYLDDWQEVDGIKYPFTVSERFPKLTLTFTVKEIKHNVPLDASLFEMH